MSAARANCPNCGAQDHISMVEQPCKPPAPTASSSSFAPTWTSKKWARSPTCRPTVRRFRLSTEGIYRNKAFVGRRPHPLRIRARRLERMAHRDQRRHQRMALRRANRIRRLRSWRSLRRRCRPRIKFALDQQVHLERRGPTRSPRSPSRTTTASKANCRFEYWDKTDVKFADCAPTTANSPRSTTAKQPPLLFLGEFVEFDNLKFKNLASSRVGHDGGGPSSPRSRSAVKALNCPQCGAAINLRSFPQAVTVVCGLPSILDAKDSELAVLQQFNAAARTQANDPARHARQAATAPLRNDRLPDAARIFVEGARYEWHEYLLFNPYKGFRYLSEYQGHWNDINPSANAVQPTVEQPARRNRE